MLNSQNKPELSITILADNQAGNVFQAEHGLSYLIEVFGLKILFDAGQSDLFIRNASKLHINLEDVDFKVLSHGHYDHGNGFHFLNGGYLISHPGCFVNRYRKKDNSYIGLNLNKKEFEDRFKMRYSSAPLRMIESVWFLGEIPRLTNFESQTTDFIFDDGSEDFVTDDSGIAVVMQEGLFVVTGCGHSGIVNTLKHAIKTTGVENIVGIMGGFHLKERDNQLNETVKYLLAKKVRHVIPSHCTQRGALCAFNENFVLPSVKTGDVLIY
jgi:7,8-dihydropterin-6-yl-methyl-4-(beta-D-ribofuranosyl)aminobenzene 5'-phosphate synthase